MKTTRLKISVVSASLFLTVSAPALQPELLYGFQAAGPSNSTNANGAYPQAGLALGRDGDFYGTTSSGGANGYGTIFRVTARGILTPLVSFPFPPGGHGEGGSPSPSGLVLADDNSFYGTTAGQPFHLGRFPGSIFRVTTGGAFTVLAPSVWLNPRDGLVFGEDGNLYGTTWDTMFKIANNGEVTTVPSPYTSNGALASGKDGAFYGTTEVGGADGFGTVFKMTADGTVTSLASFNGTNGAYPRTGLVFGTDGNLYGTTPATVYKVTTNGVMTKLAAFTGENGGNCQARLILGSDGNFYGTTSHGGSGGCNDDSGSGCGTLFRMTPDGLLTTLAWFNAANGARPRTELVFGKDGNLYGTTSQGGPGGGGTIFRLLISPVPEPANVALVGQLDPFPGNNRYGDVWGDGNFAYIGSFVDESVGIIDLSNLSAPKLAGTYKGGFTGGIFEDIQVKNGIGYFASWSFEGIGSGVHIVDVSNPASPRLLKRLTSSDQGFDTVHNVFLDGHHLYETAVHKSGTHGAHGIKLFDVSNPAAPVFVRDILTTDSFGIHDMTVINNRLSASGWGGFSYIYDVTNIGTQAPTLLGSVKSGQASHSSWVSSDGAILATCSEEGARDLRLYQIDDPAAPVLLATITSSTLGIDADTPHNPVIVGDLLFVSWYQAGLQVFNIRDPAHPLLVGSYDTFPGGKSTPGGVGDPLHPVDGCWGVYPLLGLDRVLLSDFDGGLFIVDATRLGSPDTDGDRLPDAWERQNGLDPGDPADALLDSDGDGARNVDEFLARTNPQARTNVLRILETKKSGGNLSLTFPALQGQTFRVERNSRPATNGWLVLRDEVKGTNGVATVIHSNAFGSPAQFYRVLVRP